MDNKIYYCENCGGVMEFDAASQSLKCPNCGAETEIKNEKSIRNIDWNEKIGEEEICENTKVYIISGSEEYIKEKNELIEQYYCNRDDRVKIINCYSVSEEKNLNNIIKNNNYKNILNTKGECRIKNNS